MNIISNLWGASLAYFLRDKVESDKNIFLVTKDRQQYEKILTDLTFFLGEEKLLTFPEYTIEPFEMVRVLPEIVSERGKTLYEISSKTGKIILSTFYSIVKLLPPKKSFFDSILEFRLGDELTREEIAYYLDVLGYVNVEVVTNKGEFTFRGDVFDIFPINFTEPVRIEFFDNEIEHIYTYDIETFKRLNTINCLMLLPSADLICELDEIVNKIQYLTLKEKFRTFGKFGGYFWYATHIYEKMDSVFEYSMSDNLLFFAFADIENYIDRFYDNLIEKLHNLDEKLLNNFISKRDIQKIASQNLQILVDYSDKPSTVERFKNTSLKLGYEKNNIYQSAEDFINFVKKYKDYKIIIAIENKKFEEILLKFFADHHIFPVLIESFDKIEKPGCYYVKKRFSGGFIDDENKIFVACDFEIFGFSKKRKKQQNKKDAFKTNITDLQPGDFVVHIDYGIGLYKGLVHKNIGGVEGDFLELEYSDSEILYVPIDSISQIQKYFASTGIAPKLNSLKSAKWANLKQQARKSARKIAMDLLKLYAERKATKGIVYKDEDNTYLNILENTFEYEETEDQLSAIYDVYSDMQSEKPMDRLICGDVGFGKTEVAVRAACKAASSGKQVALICPTTILAKQHFDTFTSRMKNLPFKIDYISRFRTSKEIKEILENLSEGKIDIIIGTHRLLSKDVIFKNLGLLIIDEEQRFGVSHKEKITNMKSNIDVLAMSATPIPRTLQMSLSGIRDISVIETPPVDRLPVITKLVKSDEEIRQAIEYELKRGGQVFFLENNVTKINETAMWLKNLVPFAKIDIAHGQMSSNIVEKSLERFYEGSTDVLVCSTIIENGIDVPNANTIIIKNAENFGLAQLYQLKGRVGRSAKRGYCYLYIKNFNSLSQIAKKRIQIIEQLNDLGSGFKISSYDLQLRGAGDLFGAEQSGFVVNIGYELYLQLIEEAVNELKGIKTNTQKTEIQSSYTYFIPAEYIRDPKVRINYYNQISEIDTFEKLASISDEIYAIYGKIPETVENLLYIMLLRNIASYLNIVKAVILPRKIKLIFNENSSFIEPAMFLNAINRYDIKGLFSGNFEFTVRAEEKIKLFNDTIKVLDYLKEMLKNNELLAK
ncbi:MAG: transcription-repair coupling factor [Deferribacteraceae bacterium]|jgi:transcription-repair coupling factor (superfamily II helicase)|nr:transcription-repair coupling factor [Deferribacteraceae bacterium]